MSIDGLSEGQRKLNLGVVALESRAFQPIGKPMQQVVTIFSWGTPIAANNNRVSANLSWDDIRVIGRSI